ncbi:MAG: replication endonuclease [Campylobacter sp.]|nr:replication endonuclease [Campylobacter sp.]
MGNEQIPYSNFYFSAWHNPSRYIAELNNRVASLNEYANKQGLKPIFAVFTLPSEFHKYKTIITKSGKEKLVYNRKFIDDDAHSVKAGSNKLQSVVRRIMNANTLRSIDKDKRCYITTKEPHKDGTCHLNLLLFVPAEFVDRTVEVIKRRFPSKQCRCETSLNNPTNPTAYIMKYIFKTLDDLRKNPEIDNLTDITLWYLKHNIRRFTMSKTFVSLEIYRKLNGRIGFIELTKNYNKGLITVLVDDNNKIVQIFDEIGDLWNKSKIINILNSAKCKTQRENYKKAFEQAIKDGKFNKNKELNYINYNKLPNSMCPPRKMNDFRLYNYYSHLKEYCTPEDCLRLKIVEDEMIRRELTNFTTTDEIKSFSTMLDIQNYYSNLDISEIPF